MIAWLERRRAEQRAKRKRSGRKLGRPVFELEAEMSQYEVARELGISRSRVQQLEASALRKLRALLGADE